MQPKNNNSQYNFKYLQGLVQKGDEIILKSDIALSGDENDTFVNGIEIDRDIVIDGDNHIIDACNKARIFNVNSKNVTFRNIIFKNAFSLDDGGSIKHNKGKLKIVNCVFINNNCEKYGSAIHIAPRCGLLVSNSKFLNNHANNDGCIYNFNGNMEINDSKFIKNTVSSIINQRRGRLLMKNAHFLENTSDNAGPILNYGKCDMSDCLFKNNISLADGGGINNQTKSRLDVTNTKFIGNKCRGDGGAIINFSKVNLDNAEFVDNISNDYAGAISNQKKSSLKVSKSKFINNNAEMNGGAIINWGEIDIKDCEFENNTSQELGGAIFNQESSIMNVKSTPFTNNSSNFGGAIFNWGRIHLNEVSFEDNIAQAGGAINTAKKAHCNIYKSYFKRNSSKNGDAIFNNCKNTKIIECNFSSHSTSNVIYNFRSLLGFNNVFEGNNAKNIIFNDDEAVISFSGGEFNNNYVSESAVNNIGENCSLEGVTFNNNASDTEFSADIFNKTYLILTDLKFKSEQKTVLNLGTLNFKKMDRDTIENSIHNLNVTNDLSKKDNKYDFKCLEDLIDKNTNLKLNHDYSIGNYELDFYEGGIELNRDNMIIDGCGHTINGENSSRIFIINARDVVLKDIVFKKGLFSNDYDKYYCGGGAIFVLKNASVVIENCQFIENRSMNNGGAILNDGNVKSINNKFINNKSKTFGGAIENKKKLITIDDEFKGNASRIGGAIYNLGDLCIKNAITLSDNSSQFSQGIYNAGLIASINFNISKNLIFNTSKIHGFTKHAKSFFDLANEIEESNEIELNEDIIFDFKRDLYLKYRVDIKKDLIINGCGHTIEYNPLESQDLRSFDCMNSASLFRIRKKGIKVVLKNIIFKDCYANNQNIIENNGELILKNCKFINNQLTSDKSLIMNNNSLKIINTSFSNNASKMQSLIVNKSRLEVSDSEFINNNSHAMGCCITNEMEAEIRNSSFKSNNTSDKAGCINNEFKSKLKLLSIKFEDNDADVDGGALYNYGEIEITDSKFEKNFSKEEGGAINNRTGGAIMLSNSEFIENRSKTNGGSIFNHGQIDISYCKFIKNNAKIRSGAIEHAPPLDNREETHLKISYTEFLYNNAHDNESIFSYEDADVDITDCKFKG